MGWGASQLHVNFNVLGKPEPSQEGFSGREPFPLPQSEFAETEICIPQNGNSAGTFQFINTGTT